MILLLALMIANADHHKHAATAKDHKPKVAMCSKVYASKGPFAGTKYMKPCK